MAPPEPTDPLQDCPLADRLAGYPLLRQAERILIAFSGGLDSTVLLHLLAGLRRSGKLAAQLLAVHVHHGLQPQADDWLDHCADQVRRLGVEFVALHVRIADGNGQSPEEAAREARYAALAGLMRQGSVLVLAHHADDQAETVLLHLLRGSGPRGLAGMPVQRPLGAGMVCRPLLDLSRTELQDWALAQELDWIEDPSNRDLRFSRNFLRQVAVPALRQHWPGLEQSLGRSARLNTEAEGLLAELAAGDLVTAAGPMRNQLRTDVLQRWSDARVCNLLRHWVRGLCEELEGCEPGYQVLRHCVGQLLPARRDAAPLIAWGEGRLRMELRRFGDHLYLVKPMPSVPGSIIWDPSRALQLPGVLGALHCDVEGQVPPDGLLPRFEVRFRHGGERVRLAARPTRALKHVLQEARVPPWLRPCVPLVYLEGRLLSVGGLFEQSGWPAQVPEKSVRFRWQRMQLHCGY